MVEGLIMLEWYWVLGVAALSFLVGLFTKNFLPSYMDEKGKNLATKEDIESWISPEESWT